MDHSYSPPIFNSIRKQNLEDILTNPCEPTQLSLIEAMA